MGSTHQVDYAPGLSTALLVKDIPHLSYYLQDGDAAAQAACGAAHCLLGLDASHAVLATQNEAPCKLQHWTAVHNHARQAAAAWQAGFSGSGGGLRLSSTQAAPCASELRDLATLCALHGRL